MVMTSKRAHRIAQWSEKLLMPILEAAGSGSQDKRR